MKKLKLSLILGALLTTPMISTAVLADNIESVVPYLSTNVILKLDSDYDFNYRDSLILDDLNNTTGIKLKFLRKLGDSYVFKISTSKTMNESLKILEEQNFIKKAESDVLSDPLDAKEEFTIKNNIQTYSNKKNEDIGTFSFNDTYNLEQKYFEDPAIVKGASDIQKTLDTLAKQNKKVRIAILDGGFLTHEDVSVNEGYKIASRLDESRGSNFAAITTYTDPDTKVSYTCKDGHGTAVANILAGKSNNNAGIAGVVDADLVMVKIMETNCSTLKTQGTLTDLADGIYWAIKNPVTGTSEISSPVDIINLSVGTFSYSAGCPSYLQDAIDAALDKGVIIVTSAGNESVDVVNQVPSDCLGVIPVGSNDLNGDKSTFSNYGNLLKLTAIGQGLIGANANDEDNGGYYNYKDNPLDFNNSLNGTSFSTPIVSGVIGLMREKYPEVKYDVAVRLLTKGASPHNIQSGTPNPDTDCSNGKCGSGILNAFASMSLADRKLGFPISSESIFKSYSGCEDNLKLEAMNYYFDVCSSYSISVSSNEDISSKFNIYKTSISDNQFVNKTLIGSINEPNGSYTLFDIDTTNSIYGIELCEGDNFCYPVRKIEINTSLNPDFCN